MTTSRLLFRQCLAVALAASLFASPAFADKPSKGEGGKHKSHHQKKHDDFRHDDDASFRQYQQPDRYQEHHEREHYFNDQHRGVISSYYVDEFRSGRCPPGLAKKHNGCLPPGQAKRWKLGQSLPRDVIYYDLPDRLVRQIGYPPVGYRFVRVASDILMISIGAGLVVDAIADLNAMP